MKRLSLVIMALLILVGAFIILKPNRQAVAARIVETSITVENLKLVKGPSSIVANQGDTVIINITSDKAAEVHLHGYDKKLELKPGFTQSVNFKAITAGNFEYELEDTGTTLGTLQVAPK